MYMCYKGVAKTWKVTCLEVNVNGILIPEHLREKKSEHKKWKPKLLTGKYLFVIQQAYSKRRETWLTLKL